ncbi:MAG: rod shape-determining protein MreC [Candidatus Paceibacterota bacterium]
MKKYLSTTRGNYHLTPHKQKRRKRWLILVIVFITVGLVFPWFISKVSEVVMYPVHSVVGWIKNSDDAIPVYLRSRNELLAEIEQIKAEQETKNGTQLTIRKLLDENIALRLMLGVSTSTDRVVAKVLSRPNTLAYDFLQVDQGEKQGVKVGAAVYSGLDSVVGVVVHVAEEYSFVELFTSPGFRSTAFVVGPNVFSTLEGMGGGIARVHLPQGLSLTDEQIVLLPGVFDGVYGEIVSVENHPTQPEQYGYVSPAVAMSSLYFVSIDKKVISLKTTEEIKDEVKEMVREKTRLDKDFVDAINFAEEELVDDFELATTSADIVEDIDNLNIEETENSSVTDL